MLEKTLKNNIENILKDIESGNSFGEKITLVAATKTMPIDTINKAISFGVPVVAENRVQEFNEKSPFIVGAKWHFIGRLQSNKLKYLVGKVDLIHSVYESEHAKEISRLAQKLNTVQDVLLQINIGEELSKGGVGLSRAKEIAKSFSELKGVNLKGLMAIMPKSDDNNYIASLCLKMRDMYDTLKNDGYNFDYLSMGMSNDYKIAIKNGSNMIRLGRCVFGERK